MSPALYLCCLYGKGHPCNPICVANATLQSSRYKPIAYGTPAQAGAGCQGSPSIMRQTEAALGLWSALHDTASTPSTVAPLPQHAAQSLSTDQSAA